MNTMKHLIAAAACIVPLFSVAQSGTYHIKGHVEGWKATDTVRLTYYAGNKAVVDSVAARDGRFTFTGNIAQPAKAYLFLLHPDPKARPDAISFYLEAGNITIEGKDSIRHTTLKGSRTEDDNTRLQQSIDGLALKMRAVQMQAVAVPVAQRKDSLFIALEKEYYGIRDTIRARLARFIRNNPASFVSMETLSQMAGPAINYNEVAPLFDQLNANIRNTPAGQEMAKKLAIAKKTGIGVTAPAFTSLTISRDSLSLNEVVKKGKITLVDFWASWCKPCRAENPNVVKAYTAFHDKGFNILSVSLDKTVEPWKAAIEKDGMPWYHVSGLQYWSEPVAALYGVSAVPDNFLLDEQGRILARGLRGEALYKMIEKQLNK
jgi:thiol-disulfide isomerase/thioredoxin